MTESITCALRRFKRSQGRAFSKDQSFPFVRRPQQGYHRCHHQTQSFGERELAAQHLPNVMPNDLILLDRGYPAWWLFGLIISVGADFCTRISSTKWKALRKFFHSGLPKKIIDITIRATSQAHCKQMGLGAAPLKLRLIRIENDGEVAVLTTSLINIKFYPIDIFNDLYHDRWPIEEDYKTIKCRLDIVPEFSSYEFRLALCEDLIL